jgi:hypothetical protein
MKRLLGWVTAVAVLAVAAWFGWAALTQRMVHNWLDLREADGWVVIRRDVNVTGFPLAFETRLLDVSLADPSTGLAWAAPVFTFRHAAWDPSRIEAIWPDRQTISSPAETLTLTATTLSSVLDVQPMARLALNASQTRMSGLRIDSSLGWHSQLAEGRIDMIRDTTPEPRYTLRLEATDLIPAAEITRLIDPAGLLPEAIPVVRAEARVSFDRPWDLSAIETMRPQPTRIDLTEARAEWGALMLRFAGAVDIDGEGRPTGEVAIRAQNWPVMLDMAERAGLLPTAMRQTVESVIGFLAGMTGQRDDLDVTLRLDQGFVFLGPLPIGEGPRLRLR